MFGSDKQRDLGLLILRVGIGGMFMAHGVPKLLGGPARWTSLGEATGHLGVHFAPTFFGLMAAISEAGGGLCLITGTFFQPACALMFITMVVASTQHLTTGDGFAKASHAIESAILFLSLWLIGPGSYRVRIGR